MAFDHPEFDAHQQVAYCCDPAVGLRAIIALHRVRSGKALGGIRFFNYPNADAALTDVLRLSRAMSYKWALAGYPMGGGKAVVLLEHPADKTPELLRSLGRFVAALGGRYICAPDVGSTSQDMAIIREETEHVAGLPGADTSVPTALGLFHGIRAMARAVHGVDSLQGLSVAVQGAGGVGSKLCRHLVEAGARVLVADVDPERAAAVAEATGAEVCPAEKVLSCEVDILSPCAMGGVLNEASIASLKAPAVCGAANNQLATPEDAERLAAANIAWAPDYVVSAGGIIGGTRELGLIDQAECERRLAGIYDTTLKVLDLSKAERVNTDAAARSLAESQVNGTTPAPADSV